MLAPYRLPLSSGTIFSMVNAPLPTARLMVDSRKRLEQLCRHITRPVLSDEWVQLNAAGQVELALKTPWRDAPRTW